MPVTDAAHLAAEAAADQPTLHAGGLRPWLRAATGPQEHRGAPDDHGDDAGAAEYQPPPRVRQWFADKSQQVLSRHAGKPD
ncbi:hypothetical protein [Mycobacterium sp. MS1601]|uniref:hypothetical protein n=1 Tax=Mycobacterium sp. MS1601 TaxID=1936029 RepID=UPI001F2F83D6|nr:hypothetical protein [Mycobacterium sp. MS1601]